MTVMSTNYASRSVDSLPRVLRIDSVSNTALSGGTAYYCASVDDFVGAAPDAVLGAIAANSDFAVDPLQRNAWVAQIPILKSALDGVLGYIFLEFNVPRIGSRIDAVLISGPIIFVIEFKVGEKYFKRNDINQAWDYALDLKNFHKASHNASIVPILVATNAVQLDTELGNAYSDNVWAPVCCGANDLRRFILLATTLVKGEAIDAQQWGNSPYEPTPTIIEAAQTLYARHSVEAIARHGTGTRNLGITSRRIESLIDEARERGRKVIIFVTGVPGAGKTLVGLNVATKRREENATHAVFLSGNGPLVAVLREALTRDEVNRLRGNHIRARKGEVAQKVKSFIQNVHHFRDDGVRNIAPPSDHVVIFDEAQRAWNREMTSSFMRRRRQHAEFNVSEPEFLISCLDRHKDWAVVVCLVGGGQEINRGEAGISAWLDAVNTSYPLWSVYISPELIDHEYAAGHALKMLEGRASVFSDESLHLPVSMRTFRADKVSAFVKALLDCDRQAARDILMAMSSRYPIAVTRDLGLAKDWVRRHARGSERFGLVASSGAQRLKPHAIDVRVDIDPIHWFLNGADDTRSSYYLEDAATEFQVQGLELDWVCMTWDADLRFNGANWKYHSFVGTKWTNVGKAERQQYLLNAYRVLLTRARQGMVIFVPRGNPDDATRPPAYYNSTFEYLADLGISVLAN